MKGVCKQLGTGMDYFVIGRTYEITINEVILYPPLFKVIDEYGKTVNFSSNGLHIYFDIVNEFKFGR
jgi:hypothetical protein